MRLKRRPLYRRRLRHTWPVAVIGTLVLLAGCAGGKWRVPGDISSAHQMRRAETARHFQATKVQAEIADARSLLSRHDFGGCRERLERVLSSNPGQREARLLMAEVLLVEDRPAEAIALLDPMVEGHEDDAALQHSLGLARDAAGESDRALAHYERAARLRPENELYGMSYQQARAAIQATEITPASFLESTHGIGAPHRPARGEAAPAKASRQDSAMPGMPLGDRGSQRIEEGLADRAGERRVIASQEGVGSSGSDPQRAIEQAIGFIKENQPERAVRVLQAALEDSPRSAGIYRALGMALYRSGDYRSAQAALQQALSLDNTSGLSYFLMGCVLSRLGQNEAAETQFRQARAVDPQWAARLPAGTAPPIHAMR